MSRISGSALCFAASALSMVMLQPSLASMVAVHISVPTVRIHVPVTQFHVSAPVSVALANVLVTNVKTTGQGLHGQSRGGASNSIAAYGTTKVPTRSHAKTGSTLPTGAGGSPKGTNPVVDGVLTEVSTNGQDDLEAIAQQLIKNVDQSKALRSLQNTIGAYGKTHVPIPQNFNANTPDPLSFGLPDIDTGFLLEIIMAECIEDTMSDLSNQMNNMQVLTQAKAAIRSQMDFTISSTPLPGWAPTNTQLMSFVGLDGRL